MAISKEKDAITNGGEKVRAAEDRIYVDNSSLVELKTTCDEAVERVSLQSSQSSFQQKTYLYIPF